MNRQGIKVIEWHSGSYVAVVTNPGREAGFQMTLCTGRTPEEALGRSIEELSRLAAECSRMIENGEK